MRLKLLALLLIAALLLPSAKAQVPGDIGPCTLDMAKMVEIMSDYSLEHQNKIGGGQFWGLTDFYHKIIYVDSTPDFVMRRTIVLHEMLHVCYRMKGIDTSAGLGEIAVQMQAQALYLKLFGSE